MGPVGAVTGGSAVGPVGAGVVGVVTALGGVAVPGLRVALDGAGGVVTAFAVVDGGVGTGGSTAVLGVVEQALSTSSAMAAAQPFALTRGKRRHS